MACQNEYANNVGVTQNDSEHKKLPPYIFLTYL